MVFWLTKNGFLHIIYTSHTRGALRDGVLTCKEKYGKYF